MPPFPKLVGEVLRGIRRERKWSLAYVSRISQGRFKPSILSSYERGERNISLERFCDLSRIYQVPPDRLLARVLEEQDENRRPSLVIDLDRLDLLDERDARALAEFIHEVRALRHGHFSGIISLRRGDLEEIAARRGEHPSRLLQRLAPISASGQKDQSR